MGLERVLLCLLVVCPGDFVQGIVIDPQKVGSTSEVHVHCVTSDELIQIKDPFNAAEFHSEKFIAMEWYQYRANETHETMLIQVLKNNSAQLKLGPKFTVYEFWGLQINNVNVADSAEYRAKYARLSQQHGERSVQIVVARPPVLASEKLSINRKVNQNDKSVTVSCGQISDRGSPPISILLKMGNGTVLPAAFNNGVVEVVISASEADTSKIGCEIDMSAPAARCIDSKELLRWQGVVPDTTRSQSAGPDMVGIIAGVVAGVVLLLIIIIIIIIIVLRRSKNKTKTYNTQEHEQKRFEPQGNTTSLLTDYENPYDKPYTGAKPIYKGPPDPGPYMVSQLTQGDPNRDSEYEEMDCANGNQSRPQQTVGMFIKRGDEKDKKRQEKEVKRENNNEKEKVKGKTEPKPPRAKPRSIFLTPSMEELDKIGQAVAGGEGSQPAVALGTQV